MTNTQIADARPSMFVPDEGEQLTMGQLSGNMTEDEISFLLESPSLPLTEAQTFTSTTSASTQAIMPVKSPKKKQPKEEKPMTTTKTKTAPVTQGWETINNRDTQAITAYASAHGVTPAGTLQLITALSGQAFLSDAKIYDLSSQFNTLDETKNMVPSRALIGAVAVRTGNAPQCGFQFMPDVEQKVFLVKGTIFTTLENPDPITRVREGAAQALYVCFPETIPKVPAQKGTNGVTLEAYRPMLRLIIQNIADGADGTEEGGSVVNPFFQERTRGVERFNDHVPILIYENALKADLTSEDLLVRYTDTQAINLRSQHRAQNPRNRAGVPANTAQGVGTALPSFQPSGQGTNYAATFLKSVGIGNGLV